MKLYDISMTVSETMTVYKNIEANRPILSVIKDQGGVHESRLSLNLHTGTHIDAPLHMIASGKKITDYPLETFVRPCTVLDLTDVKDKITAGDLEKKAIVAGDFLLLKTRNSKTDDFDPGFVYLDASGAEYLASKGIVGVGIDSLGIERSQPDHKTHKTLLSKQIAILEGLRLQGIEAKSYLLLALPLKIENGEASPVRAVLVEEGK